MTKKNTGRPSSVETSPHRKEIEEMLREGKSPDFISDWLKSLNINISRSAIYRYKNDKFNIKSEAIKKYNNEKSKERLDTFSNEYVNEIKFCDKLIEKGVYALDKLDCDVKHDIDKETPITQGRFLLDVGKAGLQAAKIKNGMIKNEPEPNDNNYFELYVNEVKVLLKKKESNE